MKNSRFYKITTYHVKAIDGETGEEHDLGSFDVQVSVPRFEKKDGRLVTDVKARGLKIFKMKLRRFAYGVMHDILSGMISLMEVTK